MCELGQTVLVQYHNYLVQGQEVQTIDIQAGYGFGGSDYAFRNSLARLWSTGQASKWQKRNDVSGRGGGINKSRATQSLLTLSASSAWTNHAVLIKRPRCSEQNSGVRRSSPNSIASPKTGRATGA